MADEQASMTDLVQLASVVTLTTDALERVATRVVELERDRRAMLRRMRELEAARDRTAGFAAALQQRVEALEEALALAPDPRRDGH